jgi:predicted RecA/RadA family phage recombinase
MKNFVQPGQYSLTVTAPANVTSGQLVIVGAIFGVAAWDATEGTPVEISPEVVFDLAKNPPDALVAGAVAKVTVANGVGVVAAAGTAAIGWVVQAAAAGSTTARVKLMPAVAGTPTVLAEPAAPNRKSA